MRVSIVTISYNQAKYLEQAILSVVKQGYPNIEYIVVDPGSTDESRDIIYEYRDRIDKIIFEPDEGPADGLNKGFSIATGEIFGFINADDFFLPGAIERIVDAFLSKKGKHVISGHSIIINKSGNMLRKFYSRKYNLKSAIYGASTLAQQSTFFLRKYFYKANGFNKNNHIAWDGELWIDMALNRAKFGLLNEFISAFRIYPQSISLNRDCRLNRLEYESRIFKKVCGRDRQRIDIVIRWMMKMFEYSSDPRIPLERFLRGPTLSLK